MRTDYVPPIYRIARSLVIEHWIYWVCYAFLAFLGIWLVTTFVLMVPGFVWAVVCMATVGGSAYYIYDILREGILGGFGR